MEHSPLWRIQHPDGMPCKACPRCLFFRIMHVAGYIAKHSLLLLPEKDEKDEFKAEERQELARYYMGLDPHERMRPLVQMELDKKISCKLDVALKMVRNFISRKHKTIIFYESLRLGLILHRWALSNGINFEVIDGSVTSEARQQAVDNFNNDSFYSVFMISKKAGGTGLNVTGASRVLIFEPCWNPVLDLQAQDRAYRLGQKKEVKVYRLLTENTIEHYVFKTALKKSQLAGAILDNTEENWKVRDDEVGSARAMLTIGGNEEYLTNENENIVDSSKLVPTKDLVQEGNAQVKTEVKQETNVVDNNMSWNESPDMNNNNNNGEDTGAVLGDEFLDSGNAEDEMANLNQLTESVQKADGTFDSDEEEQPVPEENEARRRRRRRLFVNDEEDSDWDKDDEVAAEERRQNAAIELAEEKVRDSLPTMESQFIDDEVLEGDEAGRQVVMFSTKEAKKDGMMMGEERKEGGGIGADEDHLDSGKWVAPPMTQLADGDDDEEEELRAARNGNGNRNRNSYRRGRARTANDGGSGAVARSADARGLRSGRVGVPDGNGEDEDEIREKVNGITRVKKERQKRKWPCEGSKGVEQVKAKTRKKYQEADGNKTLGAFASRAKRRTRPSEGGGK